MRTVSVVYLYHGTNRENLSSIREVGLAPPTPAEATFQEFGERGGVFVTSSERLAESFAEDRRQSLLADIGPPPGVPTRKAFLPAILRFPKNALPASCRVQPDILPGGLVVPDSFRISGCDIPRSIMQVRRNKKWARL